MTGGWRWLMIAIILAFVIVAGVFASTL